MAVFFDQQQPGMRGCLNGAGQRTGARADFNDTVMGARGNKGSNAVADIFTAQKMLAKTFLGAGGMPFAAGFCSAERHGFTALWQVKAVKGQYQPGPTLCGRAKGGGKAEQAA